MAETRRGVESHRITVAEPEPTGWVGWIFFAGIALMLIGALHAMAGFVALLDDGYYAVTANKLALDMNYTAWGWTHLVLGLAAVFAGYGVMVGQLWARIYAIVVAAVSLFAHVLFLAAYPAWGIVVITLDVLVIYALAVHGRELKVD